MFQQTISGQMVQDINNGADGLTAEGGGLDVEAYEKRCKEKLRRDLASEACWQQGPLKMGRDWVERVEDTYSEAKGLRWVSFLAFTSSICSFLTILELADDEMGVDRTISNGPGRMKASSFPAG